MTIKSEISVTVVMAARNESVYVKSAVSSILNQQGVLFELIFVDDNSTDNTLEQVTALAEADNRLRVFVNPHPGKAQAFSYGVSLAQGQFVCLFAGDDIMPEGSLAARYDIVKAFADECVVGLSKLKTISDDPHFDGMVTPKAKGKGGFTGVSYMFSKKALNVVFPIPFELPNEDTWIEACLLYLPNIKLVHSDIISCHWRVHSGNSINMQGSFSEYNSKLTPRLKAFQILYDRDKDLLPLKNKRRLKGRVDCESARVRGSIVGVLLSNTGIVEKLRAISAINSFFYNLRKRMFKIFSGL
jgi:glycosyltransferase involved in cell wall biosynthesis